MSLCQNELIILITLPECVSSVQWWSESVFWIHDSTWQNVVHAGCWKSDILCAL